MSRACRLALAYPDPWAQPSDGWGGKHIARSKSDDYDNGFQPASTSVLIVSEDSVTVGLVAEKLGRDGRIAVCGVASPGAVGAAIKRFQPDVVLTDRWFDRSRIGYRDAVLPFVARAGDVRLVVLDEAEAGNRKAGSASQRVAPCSRSSFLEGTRLADMVLRVRAL